MKKSYRRWVFALAFLLELPYAHASPRSFNFVFDGAPFLNFAMAVGTITFDDALLKNTFDPLNQYAPASYGTAGPEVLALSVTVSGALSGNGSFSAGAFDRVDWLTNGTLDLNAQLVGQPTRDDPWGTSSGYLGGEFNLFGVTADAPTGETQFVLAAKSGESMLLVSMTPVAAVPEPRSAAMFACGLGLLVFVASRSKRRTAWLQGATGQAVA